MLLPRLCFSKRMEDGAAGPTRSSAVSVEGRGPLPVQGRSWPVETWMHRGLQEEAFGRMRTPEKVFLLTHAPQGYGSVVFTG